jgi:hypothetical protein
LSLILNVTKRLVGSLHDFFGLLGLPLFFLSAPFDWARFLSFSVGEFSPVSFLEGFELSARDLFSFFSMIAPSLAFSLFESFTLDSSFTGSFDDFVLVLSSLSSFSLVFDSPFSFLLFFFFFMGSPWRSSPISSRMLQMLLGKHLLVGEGGHGKWGTLLEDLLELAVKDGFELFPLLLELRILRAVLFLVSMHRHL